jgi:hypothetical protein
VHIISHTKINLNSKKNCRTLHQHRCLFKTFYSNSWFWIKFGFRDILKSCSITQSYQLVAEKLAPTSILINSSSPISAHTTIDASPLHIISHSLLVHEQCSIIFIWSDQHILAVVTDRHDLMESIRSDISVISSDQHTFRLCFYSIGAGRCLLQAGSGVS